MPAWPLMVVKSWLVTAIFNDLLLKDARRVPDAAPAYESNPSAAHVPPT
jgi:hypothetical protein